MALPSDIETAIDENARGPKRVTVNGETVEQHDLDAQIRADQYVAGKTAAQKNHLGLRFTKMVPPGAG